MDGGGQGALIALILLPALAGSFVNGRYFYFADPQSLNLLFLVLSIVTAAVAQSWLGLAGALLLAYARPKSCGIPVEAMIPERRESNPGSSLVMGSYPGLSVLAIPRVSAWDRLFSALPDGARFLTEGTGVPPPRSDYRRLWAWSRFFLPTRGVEQADYECTHFLYPDLSQRYLACFAAPGFSGAEMVSVARALGVSAIITRTTATREALEAEGWRTVTSVASHEVEAFRHLVPHPPTDFCLVCDTEPVRCVTGAKSWRWEGSDLVIGDAQPGPLRIRYAWNPCFRARQGPNRLRVNRFTPIEGLSVQFMEIDISNPGEVRLEFRRSVPASCFQT